MTPEEKANEIFDKMMQTISSNCEHQSYCTDADCKWKGMVVCRTEKQESKQCAIICVDECIEVINESMLLKQSKRDYYQQVKQALEKL